MSSEATPPACIGTVELLPSEYDELLDMIRALEAKSATLVCEYLANGFNGTRAAIAAGYKVTSARTMASQVLAKRNISRIVDYARSIVAARQITSLERRKIMCSKAAEDCFKGHGQFSDILPDGEVVYTLTDKNRHSLALKSVKQSFTKKPGEGDGMDDVITRDIETRDFLPYIQELNKMEAVYAAAEPGGSGSGMTVNFNIIAQTPREKPAIDVPSEIVESPRLKKTFALAIAKKANA